MNRSEDRILTSHIGSLHMPAELKDLLLADWRSGRHGNPELSERLSSAVDDVVRKQVELGIDVINDGEFSKATWCNYVLERMSGFDLRERALAHADADYSLSAHEAQATSKDMEMYSEYYAEAGMAQMFYVEPGAAMEMLGAVEETEPIVTGPVDYVGESAIQRDIANLKAALEGVTYVDAFMPAVAPGSVFPLIKNEHYGSDEELFGALAAALSKEYKAIVDAGLIVQVDDAYLPSEWDRRALEPDWTLEKYRAWAALSVEALNAALEGIPEDRVRYHVCWGSWNGPHVTDIPLTEIVDLILKVNAQTYALEAANTRHEWEFRVWEDVSLPEGKILMPGVIEHSTNVVEHPRTVAERILRFANILGRENVIAGTDCGFRDRVHPQVAWAKLEALTEGARLASAELWK